MLGYHQHPMPNADETLIETQGRHLAARFKMEAEKLGPVSAIKILPLTFHNNKSAKNGVRICIKIDSNATPEARASLTAISKSIFGARADVVLIHRENKFRDADGAAYGYTYQGSMRTPKAKGLVIRVV